MYPFGELRNPGSDGWRPTHRATSVTLLRIFRVVQSSVGPSSSSVTSPGRRLWGTALALPGRCLASRGVVRALPVDPAARVGRGLSPLRERGRGSSPLCSRSLRSASSRRRRRPRPAGLVLRDGLRGPAVGAGKALLTRDPRRPASLYVGEPRLAGHDPSVTYPDAATRPGRARSRRPPPGADTPRVFGVHGRP